MSNTNSGFVLINANYLIIGLTAGVTNYPVNCAKMWHVNMAPPIGDLRNSLYMELKISEAGTNINAKEPSAIVTFTHTQNPAISNYTATIPLLHS